MWRIIKGIGRGLRSVRPSQWCPQDCSEESPNYHLTNNGVPNALTAARMHCSAASSWSPLTIARYDTSLEQVTLGATKPEDINTRPNSNGRAGADGTNNRCCHQRCPPWHWDVLENNDKVLKEWCSEGKEKRKEDQSKEDWRSTWPYQEWKEVLQASPTLHTLGLGSAAALTLSLYRDWRKHYPCPYQAKDEQQQVHHSPDKKCNLKDSYAEEQYQEYQEPCWSNSRASRSYSNHEVHSQEISSDVLDKDCSRVVYKVPNHPSNNAFCNQDVIKSPENEAHGPTICVSSILQKSLDLATTFFSIQESVVKENKFEKVYDEEVDESEVLFFPDVTDRTDSGCVSDIYSGIAKDKFNEESNDNMTVSVIGIARPVTIEPEFQVEVKVTGSENSQGSRTHKEPEVGCADGTKVTTIHDRLLEIVKADREDQLQEFFKKDGNTMPDTNPEEAIVYFQAGVMMGDPSSAFNLALCYHMGYGIEQDLEKAQKLYEAAAAAGHGWAMYNLAVMVSQGLAGPYSTQRVQRLIQQAAEMGIMEAVEALSALKMGEPEHRVSYEEEPQLRKCDSEPTLSSCPITQKTFSHSAAALDSLLDDLSADSDLFFDVICKKS